MKKDDKMVTEMRMAFYKKVFDLGQNNDGGKDPKMCGKQDGICVELILVKGNRGEFFKQCTLIKEQITSFKSNQ